MGVKHFLLRPKGFLGHDLIISQQSFELITRDLRKFCVVTQFFMSPQNLVVTRVAT